MFDVANFGIKVEEDSMWIRVALALLLLIPTMHGCEDAHHSTFRRSAPTPSESGSCKSVRERLGYFIESAQKGSSEDMYALGVFYSVCDGEDQKGEDWTRRAADAGSKAAQGAILSPLEDPRSRSFNEARAAELRARWRLTAK